ncbi:MAG: response regulator, partial [Euryarchaeota archaeon]|nr:response regulator [Euryarchaeota archaeon]
MHKEQKGIKVLLVDDEPDFLALTKAFLEKEHAEFSIDTATSAEKGIELLKSGKYDVVVSDYKMPVMDGLEFLKTLRASGNMTPFIMFTGKGREEVAIEALNRGANGYLQKGTDIKSMYGTLAHVIRAEVKKTRAEDALRESETRYKSLYSMVRLMCDNVPDMIWAKDLEKKFIFANKAICEQLLNAKDTDEPIGKTDIYFAGRERRSHPDHPRWHDFGEICTDSDSVVMKSRKAERFDEFGNVKGEFLFLDVHKAPFWDEQRKMIGTVGCGRIVTKEKQIEEERKQAEEALRESEGKYRLLSENSQDIIYAINKNYEIVSAMGNIESI